MIITQSNPDETYTMCDTSSMDQHIYLDFDSKPDIKKSNRPFLKRSAKRIILCAIVIVTTAVLSSGLTFAVLYFNGNYNSEGKHQSSVVNISRSCENLNFRVTSVGTRCPFDWYNNGAACYLIRHEKRTWFQARDFCRSNGSDLVSFHSKAEVDSLPKNQLKEEPYWTGLNEIDHKGTFKWSDGTPLDYKNWNLYEPNHWNNFEHCVEMEHFTHRKWNDGNCYVSQSFICKLSLTDKCGNGNWYLHNGSCYLFNPSDDTKLSWAAARQFCLRKGADLISIGSDNEFSFVLSQAFQLSTSRKWIGLNDLTLIGEYKWLDGTVSKNLTWANGEPNDKNEHCVFFGRLGNIYDHDCATLNGYICEKVL
ncbi:macrophage mannose receptor 1-like [Mytilus edulis]|uniref:macrophage mannose receptor 1-like n=1 Tax=Mytilus edulis TaxID=6550 RepID=UPI0039F0AF7C